MNIYETLKALQNLTNSKFTQVELGKALGKTRSDINGKAKRGSELKLSEIKKIEKYIYDNYNLKIDLLNTKIIQDIQENDLIKIVVKNKAKNQGLGIRCDKNSNEPFFKISKDFIEDFGIINKDNTMIIFANGDSMNPAIEDGDYVLVDCNKKEVYDGKIYCIKIKNQLTIKRLQNIPPDKIKVISDNFQKYDAFYIENIKNQPDFSIIGQVLWWARTAK